MSAPDYNVNITKHSVSGTAVLFPDPIDLENQIDIRSGRVVLAGHPLEGKKITNKIMVAPNMSYNPDLEFLIYLFAVNKCSPKAFVVNRASSNLVLGAVLADIPVIYGFLEDLTEVVKTGDHIAVDFEKKSIEIKKRD